MQKNKNSYQPPKLKIKSKWMPPKENNDSNQQSEDDEKHLRKSVNSNALLHSDNNISNPSVKINENKPKGIKLHANKKGRSSVKNNTISSFAETSGDMSKQNMMYDDTAEDNRVPWENWGRKFNPDRIEVHLKSCNNMKKRKVFDMKKKRAADGAFKMTNTKSETKNKTSQKNAVSDKKAKWRREHDQFIKAIKMSRLIKKVEMEGGDVSKIPVAPSEPNDDYIEWQYWYRRFAPKVADRHIPKCKDMINRPKPPPHILKKMQSGKNAKLNK